MAVELPHTWRPLGVRVAVIAFGAMLILICAFAWFGFSPEVRDKFTILQRITLLALGAAYGTAGYAISRSRAVAVDSGLHVINGFRRYYYDWPEVVAVHLPAGAPWATLDLADGTTRSVMAIQNTDGGRARSAVRELRSLIDR